MIKKIFSLLLLITFLIPTTVYADTVSYTEKYDVVVIGGEPEGVAAAVSAARNGSKVLLIDERDKLGGLLTVSEMNIIDISRNFLGEETSQGIFKEFHNMIGGTLTADVKTTINALNTLVKNEPNITLRLNSKITDINNQKSVFSEGLFINTITITQNGVKRNIDGKIYIDATADGDFSADVGVPYTYGNEDIDKDTQMAVTLMMHFKNVDWSKMAKYTKETGIGSVSGDVAWGYWDFVEYYVETEPNTNLRGLNIGKDKSGDVYINALQIFNVDGVDEKQKAEAIEVGKKETKHILEWLRKNLPGFENAEIADYPEELYVRETRHIEPIYKLSIVDVFENKDQWDKIAFGGYPVDMQATDKGEPNLIVVNPNQYAIPFRSIVPNNVYNLLVTSKASGYESLAAGSVRVVPTGMAVGEAGGLAASMAVKNDVHLHSFSEDKTLIAKLQETLRKNGAFLPETSELTYPYENTSYYEDMKVLYTRGLLHLDYSNNLHENEIVTSQTFYDELLQILPEGTERSLLISSFKTNNKGITMDVVRSTLYTLYGEEIAKEFKIPTGNGNLLVKDFVIIKANLVLFLDELEKTSEEISTEVEEVSTPETKSK